MEFRIAPMIMALINLFFIVFVLINYHFNHQEINIKMILLPLIILFVAKGAFKSHHYYKQTFKTAFYIIQLCNIIGIVFLVIASSFLQLT